MPKIMSGVHLIGHGDFDKLVYREDIPCPSPRDNEVLIKVGAAGINNTDINTRVGWYSKAATGDTQSMADNDASSGNEEDAAWGGSALHLPRIQGIDICGEIIEVGKNVTSNRIGERVLVSPCLYDPQTQTIAEAGFVGSECDGGFAQYVSIPSNMVYQINSSLPDSDLASFPCSYSTAENLLHRANLKPNERVLITGASGGVGSAAVQLAKRRGANVIAISSKSKHDEVRAAGADHLLDRDVDLMEELGENSVDVVIDIVGGPSWPKLLEVLRVGGRYGTSGAIAGPIVELDLRTLYLKDLTLVGATVLDEGVFQNLVSYIEKGEIKPIVANTYPLKEIVQAQKDFLEKKHTGKLVLIP